MLTSHCLLFCSTSDLQMYDGSFYLLTHISWPELHRDHVQRTSIHSIFMFKSVTHAAGGCINEGRTGKKQNVLPILYQLKLFYLNAKEVMNTTALRAENCCLRNQGERKQSLAGSQWGGHQMAGDKAGQWSVQGLDLVLMFPSNPIKWRQDGFHVHAHTFRICWRKCEASSVLKRMAEWRHCLLEMCENNASTHVWTENSKPAQRIFPQVPSVVLVTSELASDISA